MMLLNDKIVASYVEGFSGVNIYCTNDSADTIEKEFLNLFEVAWNQAMDDAEEEYDAVCVEKEDELELPATVSKSGGKVFIELGPLYLSMNYGARADNEHGTRALEGVLKALKEKYPDISYEGVIAYESSDEHSGDVINYEINSDKKVAAGIIYDFIKDKLIMVLTDDNWSEEFWEKLEINDPEEDDYREILENFIAYGVPQDAIDQLIEMAEEYDDELAEELQEMLECDEDDED